MSVTANYSRKIFNFFVKIFLQKIKLIKYLKETQTTILNLVTSAKSQEKTQGKILKLNVPQQQQQQNLQSQHIQQHFSREHNTCQDQPQFEHEIFETNFRKKNSKESNSQKKLKTFL